MKQDMGAAGRAPLGHSRGQMFAKINTSTALLA